MGILHLALWFIPHGHFPPTHVSVPCSLLVVLAWLKDSTPLSGVLYLVLVFSFHMSLMLLPK